MCYLAKIRMRLVAPTTTTATVKFLSFLQREKSYIKSRSSKKRKKKDPRNAQLRVVKWVPLRKDMNGHYNHGEHTLSNGLLENRNKKVLDVFRLNKTHLYVYTNIETHKLPRDGAFTCIV